jgi:hypothetical protein
MQNLVEVSNQQLFVGVDEYDAPAKRALFSSDPELYNRVTEFFSSCFFATIKRSVQKNIIPKYWLTGVLPAFRDGIGPLSATRNISNSAEYHGLCGLTDAEVRTITQAYLGPKYTPEKLEEAMDVLRRWYRGYRFCPSTGENILPSIYNPQLVFTHLRDMRQKGQDGPQNFEPKEEIEAIHLASVLDALSDEGEASFVDMFVRVSSGVLDPDIHHQFSANDVRNLDSMAWVSQTLLYFFGVFSYAKETKFLTIPNETMRQLVRMITMYRT